MSAQSPAERTDNLRAAPDADDGVADVVSGRVRESVATDGERRPDS